MTINEKYFCELVLLGKNKTIDVKVNELARQIGLSPNTIRNALSKLEIAGCIKIEKNYKCTTIKILKQELIKKVVQDGN